MHIYIDESGSFSGVGQEGSAVSAVGALILDDALMPKLFRRYERLRANLPKNKAGEVKVSKLDEQQVAAVVDLLRRNGAVFRPGSVPTKHLVRQNAHEDVLEQFNPHLVSIVPREQVVRIHRVVRTNHLLF